MKHLRWSIRVYEHTTNSAASRVEVVITSGGAVVQGFGANTRDAFNAAENNLHHSLRLPLVFFGGDMFFNREAT